MKNLLAIKSVICAVFGALFLVAPVWTLNIYDIALDDAGALMVRFLGAAFIVLCVLLWMARRDEGSPALLAIIYGVFVGDFVGFIVALYGVLANIGNALGWVNVAIYLLLTVGFGYFVINAPEVRPQPTA
jgi:uncharacterized membrane-anchored protein YitT (DUF2179 family)